MINFEYGIPRDFGHDQLSSELNSNSLKRIASEYFEQLAILLKLLRNYFNTGKEKSSIIKG